MEETQLIDWASDESHVLLNPRMPEEERRQLESLVVDLSAHVWLATSGTTGALKLTALSKRALLLSAAAVNRHLESTANDIWCCVLPAFHVGGLGIHARAFLSGAGVMSTQWDPQAFASMNEMTLTSLVPAQVGDLVQQQLRPPQKLRAIVVGGGVLRAELYESGSALGWPLLPSYGMTECCSQIATARQGSPELLLLDHVEVRTESDGRLAIRSESLLTGYATRDGFLDPKVAGWFLTEDYGSIDGRTLQIEGRRGDFVKIGGESVDLSRLDAIVASIAGVHAAVVAVPDARLGHVIHLAVDAEVDAEAVASAFNVRAHPFERARQIHRVAEIPRTSLGKLMRSRLLELLPKVME